MRTWGELSWAGARDAVPGAIVLWPIGAVEAHGPHLPLDTDVLISHAMAEEGARRLEADGRECLLLPDLAYSPAPFAASHAGTLGLSAETMGRVVREVGGGVLALKPRALVLVTAHMDPAQRSCLRGAAAHLGGAEGAAPVVFPNLARRAYAGRLGSSFQAGDHAGAFETSCVLAIAPDRVDREAAKGLPANEASLVDAIEAGATTFADAGGPEAYFGDPAAATAERGREHMAELGAILVDALAEALP